MVQFTNIKQDENFIYADAEDKDAKRIFKIKVSKDSDEFYTNPEDFTYSVAKALWPMVREFNKRKGDLKDIGITWG